MRHVRAVAGMAIAGWLAASAAAVAWRRAKRGIDERAEALEHAKSDFVSTVSHELRTPLTSMSGYLELLRDPDSGELTDTQDRMLEVIARNTRRLRDLIEDMLTLSRIEAGEYRCVLAAADLAQIVERAVASAAPAAARASVGLRADIRGPLPLRGDGPQLDRALANLLGNAIKFTPAEGVVTVRARQHLDEAVLVVSDTGMGVPAPEVPELFGRFYRASNAVRLAIPGAGLGLAIVRAIVENHHGSIDVDSTENVGTVVTVRLPA
jgi:signal transduction histidine kinase